MMPEQHALTSFSSGAAAVDAGATAGDLACGSALEPANTGTDQSLFSSDLSHQPHTARTSRAGAAAQNGAHHLKAATSASKTPT